MINIALSILLVNPLYIWIKHRTKIAHELIKNWVETESYQIIDIEYKFFFRGPWMFINGSLMVYRFTLKNSSDEEYKGWIGIGHWYLGLLGKKDFEIIWD